MRNKIVVAVHTTTFHCSTILPSWEVDGLFLHSSPAITPHRMQSVSSGDLFYSEKEEKSSIIKELGVIGEEMILPFMLHVGFCPTEIKVVLSLEVKNNPKLVSLVQGILET